MAESSSALVVEGGALRSVFSAGVLDGFLAQSFRPFDFFIGVSAGASNLAFYKADAAGQSLKIFLELAENRDFISYRRFLRGGHLLDLDWLFTSYFDKASLEMDKAFSQQQPLYVCVTEVDTGNPAYIIADSCNYETLIKASTALPLIYREFPVFDGVEMTDGGVADSIPIRQAIKQGAKNIMVVRARHRTYMKQDTFGHRLIRWKLRRHRRLTQVMRERVSRHEQAVDLIRHPPAGINVIEVCPPQSFSIGRFARNREQLIIGYEEGRAGANEAIAAWQRLTNVSSWKKT